MLRSTGRRRTKSTRALTTRSSAVRRRTPSVTRTIKFKHPKIKISMRPVAAAAHPADTLKRRRIVQCLSDRVSHRSIAFAREPLGSRSSPPCSRSIHVALGVSRRDSSWLTTKKQVRMIKRTPRNTTRHQRSCLINTEERLNKNTRTTSNQQTYSKCSTKKLSKNRTKASNRYVICILQGSSTSRIEPIFSRSFWALLY